MCHFFAPPTPGKPQGHHLFLEKTSFVPTSQPPTKFIVFGVHMDVCLCVCGVYVCVCVCVWCVCFTVWSTEGYIRSFTTCCATIEIEIVNLSMMQYRGVRITHNRKFPTTKGFYKGHSKSHLVTYGGRTVANLTKSIPHVTGPNNSDYFLWILWDEWNCLKFFKEFFRILIGYFYNSLWFLNEGIPKIRRVVLLDSQRDFLGFCILEKGIFRILKGIPCFSSGLFRINVCNFTKILEDS